MGVYALAGLVFVDDELVEMDWVLDSQRLVDQLLNTLLELKRPFGKRRGRSQYIFPVIHVLKSIMLSSAFQ